MSQNVAATATSPGTSSFSSCGVTSLDPNDKVGSDGVGTQRYLRGVTPLAYTIDFENVPKATAPAAQVTISDQLDQNLDWKTFSLQTIRFGTTTVQVPSGSQQYSTFVDLRPNKNILVNIEATLVGGLFKMSLTAVDPSTGKVITDPSLGFLPPDVNPPAGQGSVFFTIVPKQGLPAGTQIKNSAVVVFDINPPINTPTWLNTIDNASPVSAVTPLGARQNSTDVLVQWRGSDVGSGIQDFTVYVSDNGNPFTAWQTNTTAISATFTGQPGHIYAFYSIARDLVGNVEASKTAAEAITQIGAATPPQIVVTRTLSRDSQNNVVVNITLANTGGSTAQTTLITVAQIGTTVATVIPKDPVNISAGGSVSTTVIFPGSIGVPGANTTLTVGGTYVGGSFTFTSRISLP